MLFSPKDRIIMVGDSITDCERKRPFASGSFGELGTGYVSLLDSLIHSSNPQMKLQFINSGIGGNTLLDVSERWDDDVLKYNPDWVCLMIGINDVWRQFERPTYPDRTSTFEDFNSLLSKIVEKSIEKDCAIILLSPFILVIDQFDQMREMTNKYREIVKAVSEKYKLAYFDTQIIFDNFCKHAHPFSLSRDRIHPNQTGHMLIARKFYEFLDKYNSGEFISI